MFSGLRMENSAPVTAVGTTSLYRTEQTAFTADALSGLSQISSAHRSDSNAPLLRQADTAYSKIKNHTFAKSTS